MFILLYTTESYDISISLITLLYMECAAQLRVRRQIMIPIEDEKQCFDSELCVIGRILENPVCV